MTVIAVQAGKAIQRGFVWRCGIDFEECQGPAPFPAGITMRAQVRAKLTDAVHVAELTTANGGIERVSDTSVRLVMSPQVTLAIPANVQFVWLSLVRTDVTPEEPFDFMLEIEVWTAPTRPLT